MAYSLLSCYLPDRATARVMPVEVADAVAEAVVAWSRCHPLRIVWHGGEPLATGVSCLNGGGGSYIQVDRASTT